MVVSSADDVVGSGALVVSSSDVVGSGSGSVVVSGGGSEDVVSSGGGGSVVDSSTGGSDDVTSGGGSKVVDSSTGTDCEGSSLVLGSGAGVSSGGGFSGGLPVGSDMFPGVEDMFICCLRYIIVSAHRLPRQTRRYTVAGKGCRQLRLQRDEVVTMGKRQWELLNHKTCHPRSGVAHGRRNEWLECEGRWWSRTIGQTNADATRGGGMQTVSRCDRPGGMVCEAGRERQATAGKRMQGSENCRKQKVRPENKDS